ncbi:uncharacterized protein LOC131951793 isoform X2 [Physella acuta]|uniref:uncharacterized protein LOC131951793 isoform X2 n=1 Tax=Physella acuta TaxID=109671 RepID=UPI0027DE0AB1|nr:uncharacterized protein LOC131951793 isoform X2 [Physella acuta]
MLRLVVLSSPFVWLSLCCLLDFSYSCWELQFLCTVVATWLPKDTNFYQTGIKVDSHVRQSRDNSFHEIDSKDSGCLERDSKDVSSLENDKDYSLRHTEDEQSSSLERTVADVDSRPSAHSSPDQATNARLKTPKKENQELTKPNTPAVNKTPKKENAELTKPNTPSVNRIPALKNNPYTQPRHTKAVFYRIVKPNFVLAADPPSLLLQSAPPFIIRSGAEAQKKQPDVTAGERQWRWSSAIKTCRPTRTGLTSELRDEFYRSYSYTPGSHRSDTTSNQLNSDILFHRFRVDSFLSGSVNRVEPGFKNDKPSSCVPLVNDSSDKGKNSSDMASRIHQRKDSGFQKSSRTLTPSKHGYHPRSQSPTFKRLLAASQLLNEPPLANKPRFSYPDALYPSNDLSKFIEASGFQGLQVRSETSIAAKTKSTVLTDRSKFKEKSKQFQQKHSLAHSLSSSEENGSKRLNQKDSEKILSKISNEIPEKLKSVEKKTMAKISTLDLHQPIKLTTTEANRPSPTEENPQFSLDKEALPLVEVQKPNGKKQSLTQIHLFLPRIWGGVVDAPVSREASDVGRHEPAKPNPANPQNNPPAVDKPKHSVHQSALHTGSTTQLHLVSEKKQLADARRHPGPSDLDLHSKDAGGKNRRPNVNGSPRNGLKLAKKGAKLSFRSTLNEQPLAGEKLKNQLDDVPTLISMDYSNNL